MKLLNRPVAVLLALFLVVLLTWTAFSQLQKGQTQHPVWEYHDGANLQIKELNDLGAQGWELTTIVPYGTDYYYVFKRRQ